jgi:hypothetical protein
MRTSLIETRQIEAHLLEPGQGGGEALVFQARLLLEPELGEKVRWQQKTYDLVLSYGRQELKKEIQAAHEQLFTRPEHASFRQKIKRLFSKP